MSDYRKKNGGKGLVQFENGWGWVLVKWSGPKIRDMIAWELGTVTSHAN